VGEAYAGPALACCHFHLSHRHAMHLCWCRPVRNGYTPWVARRRASYLKIQSPSRLRAWGYGSLLGYAGALDDRGPSTNIG
jgi:hypothetical protein